MKAPVSRCRRRWPALPTRTMDLLGVGKDGNLYVWSKDCEVQPLDRFPMNGKHITSGHYVVDRGGKAVTAHIGNSGTPGLVNVHYMCGGLPIITVSRKEIEPQLLGKYVPDPEQEAEILRMLQKLGDDLQAQQTAPHRRRGRA